MLAVSHVFVVGSGVQLELSTQVAFSDGLCVNVLSILACCRFCWCLVVGVFSIFWQLGYPEVFMVGFIVGPLFHCRWSVVLVPGLLIFNLVPRVLMLFVQLVGARRDSGDFVKM